MKIYRYATIFITILGINNKIWPYITTTANPPEISVSPTTSNDNHKANSYALIRIPKVAMIDIESTTGSSNINIAMNRTYEAGQGSLGWWEDDTLWMNYSSIIGSNEPSREISASISSGEVPSGTKLLLHANNYSSISNEGSGDFGTKTTRIILNNTPQAILTNVGSSYTGDGVENGHQLIYRISKIGKESTQDIRAGNYAPITITYTMTDN